VEARFSAVTARLGDSPAPELEGRRDGPSVAGAHSADPPISGVQVPGREGGEQCLIADYVFQGQPSTQVAAARANCHIGLTEQGLGPSRVAGPRRSREVLQRVC